MKHLFHLIFGLLAITVSAQEKNCADIRVGNFKHIGELSGITLISRTETIQHEENIEFGIITEDSVKWINDCTFRLIPSRMIKNEGKLEMEVDMTLIVEVEILRVDPKSYLQRMTSTLTGESVTTEILRIN